METLNIWGAWLAPLAYIVPVVGGALIVGVRSAFRRRDAR